MATPSLAVLEALEKLAADPANIVYIISGRDGEFLEQHLGHLKKVGFSAEHGGFVRERGATEWTNFTESLDMSWMSDVGEIFKYYTEVRPCNSAGMPCIDRIICSARLAVRLRSRRAQSHGTIAEPILSGGMSS